MKTVCAIGRLGRVGYFLSAWEAVPLPASKAAESATLPVISFPRLSPPLKIKPVSQIISQANQQSLCIWGWEEKLAIKGSMRNSVGKELCSLFYFSTSAYTLSPCGEPFPPELIFYLGAIPATNNHRNMSPPYLTQQNNHSVVGPGPSMSGNSVTSLLWTKKSLQHRMERFVGHLKERHYSCWKDYSLRMNNMPRQRALQKECKYIFIRLSYAYDIYKWSIWLTREKGSALIS